MGNKLKSVLCVCLYFYCPNIQVCYNKYGPDLVQTKIISHILKKSVRNILIFLINTNSFGT